MNNRNILDIGGITHFRTNLVALYHAEEIVHRE